MVDQGRNAAHQHSSEAEQRSSKADERSRLRSFGRDLTRVSFILATSLFRLIAPALALPTPTVTTTASSTNAAPSATSSADAKRDSSFQVFADGTQDIAALVGIFATDSVERYAIDYSKGYLATAVANLSLLGLLGYVRLLVKLGLGADGCRKAGFDMKALRPMFGVQDEDYVPTDAVHEVFYMQRKRSDGHVHWSVVKTIKHTDESFQLLKKPHDRYKEKTLEGVDIVSVDIVSVWLYVGRQYDVSQTRFDFVNGPKHVFLLPLLSILCSALTCFPIMIFERPLRHQSWTYYYATFGLFCSIVISTMIWMRVHIQEHHPRALSDWTIAELYGRTTADTYPGEAVNLGYKQVFSKTSSLDLKDTFAFSRAGTGFQIYDVSVAEPKVLRALRASSFLLSVSILIGYACQYIEVRRLSAIRSGYWLLIQGALALIRVIVWVWDPSWDDSSTVLEPMYSRDFKWIYTHGRSWDYDLTETRLAVLWVSLHSETPEWLQYLKPSPVSFRDQLSIPKWALPAFQPRNQNPEKMFELARKLRRDNIEWDESLRVLQSAEDFWDMPPSLFMAWVFAWPNSDSSWINHMWKNFSCRIIKDKPSENGVQRFHFLPCSDDAVTSVRVFGVPYNLNRCVFALGENLNEYTNSGRTHQQKLLLGCDPLISEQLREAQAYSLYFRTKEMFETMDLMWKTLDPILKAHQDQTPTPSDPAAATEPHSPTNPVRTSQQASPAGSAMELATLPCADEGRQPDADETHPLRRSSTSNNQNPLNAHSP